MAAAKFRYSMTHAGYSTKMTGELRGPDHAGVVTAALAGHLMDNATLLDAAPEMLVALKMAAEVLVQDDTPMAYAQVTRAIAKAEGRT